MKTVFTKSDCIDIFLLPLDGPEWSPVDGSQVEALIQGMEAVGAEPVDYPLTDGMIFFFADDKKAVAVEIGNERTASGTGKPFYIAAATCYAPLQRQGSTAAAAV